MDTYYAYREVGVMIAHKLMNIEGWKVYGYHADESDSMTDYYNPAYWNGIAEKNGYIFCFNVHGESQGEEIKKYTNVGAVDRSIYEKIEKLKEMRVDRGATEAEAQTAQKRIETLQNKLAAQEEKAKEYIIVGKIPAHMANPPKMNWHIEKDGVIIAKGRGVLKYADIDEYYTYSHYKKDIDLFRNDFDEWKKKTELYYKNNYPYYDKERIDSFIESNIKTMQEKSALMDQFEKFINKIDATCGGMIGNGELTTYKKITVTEYKKEIKAERTESGEIKDGQCFILNTSFNYGRFKGLVYRIHVTEFQGNIYFNAYKLNKKLTKECKGRADSSNSFYIGELNGTGYNKFMRWINKGSISFCELKEVKTPYEVEKVVKNTVKQSKQTTPNNDSKNNDETLEIKQYNYKITPDIDTRDESKIFVVKVLDRLSKDEYIKVNNCIKKLGGYYSKFKHGFIFRFDPSAVLA